ncbi:type VII secretion target [Nocardia sp. CA-290969]|uniref:type VII secretion target n=1 Tax=Nocardia sp. CA-290969 TaxID=3239986 RepID=UPI003D9127F9
MNGISAVPDAIRQYGNESAAMAAGIATTAAVDQVATISFAAPAFGLIGQEFLALFACAQADHLASATELAAVHAATALAVHRAAGSYEAMDSGNGAGFDAVHP